jgi:hypothetical protein
VPRSLADATALRYNTYGVRRDLIAIGQGCGIDSASFAYLAPRARYCKFFLRILRCADYYRKVPSDARG